MINKLKILLIIFIAILFLTVPVKAATDVTTKEVSMPKYQTVSNIKGESIACSAKSKDMQMLVVVDSEEIIEEEWDWYTKYNYKLYYTKDAINYENTDIVAEIKKIYNTNSDDRIELTSMVESSGTFYICGTITNKVQKQEEDGYRYEDWSYNTILLKTTDGKKIEKVKFPEYEEQDTGIYKYKNTYIIAGTTPEEVANYNYYTSSDLKNWTKREFSIKKLTGNETDIVKLQNISAGGVSFVIGDDYLDKSYLIITSDFVNHKKVDESSVKADSSYFINHTNAEKTEPDKVLTNYQYYVRPSAKEDTMNYTFCVTERGTRGIISEYVPAGFDFYVATPYPGQYKKMLGFNEKCYSWRILYSLENETSSNSSPLYLFVDMGGYTKVYRYNDYKSTEYTEYENDIEANKIQDIFSRSNNEIAFVYDNKEVVITNDGFKTVNKIKTPIRVNGGEKFKNKILLLGKDKSIIVDQDELFDATMTFKLGDINGDDKINTKDAREVLLTYIGKTTLTTKRREAADVNKDGKINTKDARQILLYYIGKIKKF